MPNVKFSTDPIRKVDYRPIFLMNKGQKHLLRRTKYIKSYIKQYAITTSEIYQRYGHKVRVTNQYNPTYSQWKGAININRPIDSVKAINEISAILKINRVDWKELQSYKGYLQTNFF